MNNELLWKFLKFAAVGTSGVVVDFGITYFTKEIIKINKYVANSFGFVVAATTNYFLNRIWTFHNTDPAMMIQFSKFFLISLIGLMISNGIIFLLSEKKQMNFYMQSMGL